MRYAIECVWLFVGACAGWIARRPPRRSRRVLRPELAVELRDVERRLKGWTTYGAAGVDLHRLLSESAAELVRLHAVLEEVIETEGEAAEIVVAALGR